MSSLSGRVPAASRESATLSRRCSCHRRHGPDAIAYGANFEASYNRKADSGNRWSVPLNLTISKLTRLGGQLISFQGGIRYWVDSPDTSPDDWGVRFRNTLLYPR